MEKLKGKCISVHLKTVATLAFLLLMVPTIIFFVGWLRVYWSVLFSVILIIGGYFIIKKDYWKRDRTIEIPVLTLLSVVAIFAVWILLVGNCGVSVSNYDTKWRTAMLRDLIDYQWPVYYEYTDSYLTYYHIFWMIPAVVGKLLGWHAALIALWLWILSIVTVSYLLICFILKADRKKVFWMAAVGIVTWSGVNVLGSIIMDICGWNLYGFGLGMNEAYCDMMYNGESFNFYYRSNQDFICNSYNQLVIWLGVPLMLENRKISSYAFIGLLLFPFTPWGTVGIAILMVIDGAAQLKRYIVNHEMKQLWKDLFSVPNICAVLSVFLVMVIYFKSSNRLGSDGPTFGILTLSKFDFKRVFALVIFWICEFGIYYVFLWKKYKKEVLFLGMLPVLLFVPLFWVGTIGGRDFCMNVSLPALNVLMIYMFTYIKDDIMGQTLNFRRYLFIVIITLSMGTAIMSLGEKVKIMIENRSYQVQDDSFYTYSDKELIDTQNFLNADWRDCLFFQYFAKK